MTSMNRAVAQSVALVLILALTGPGLAAKKIKLTDWQVIETFKEKDPTVCVLKFATPRGGPTLSIEGRSPKSGKPTGLFVTLGALQPLFTNDHLQIHDVSFIVDKSWGSGKITADWTRGNGPNNSRLTFYAAEKASDATSPIASGSQLVVVIPAGQDNLTFTIDLKGSGAPMTAFASCLATATMR